MNRISIVATLGLAFACSKPAEYPAVGSLVTRARADQLSFASDYQEKGVAFRGTVQKKGVKPSTAAGIDFTGYGFGNNGGGVVVASGHSRRINVNYGYVFLGEGTAQDRRALCLFEPDDLKEAAALQVGQTVTLSCLFSKFVGSQEQPTPVFWGCSVLE